MKRFLPSLILALAGLGAFTASAAANDGPGGGGGRMHGAVRRFHKCLASLDLTADQKAAVKAVLSDARPKIQADMQTLREDRQKIRADVDAGADKATIGQDVLTAHADRLKLQADAKAVKDQALAKLTPDQQAQANACLAAHSTHGSSSASQ